MIQNDTPKFRVKKESYPVAPANFNLMIMIVSSCMLFAGLISAYVVHQPDSMAKGAWTIFALPKPFYVSLIVSILSSVTMWFAYKAAKKDELKRNQWLLIATLVLGIAFCISQFVGWSSLVKMGLTFVNPNPSDISASYIYVLTGAHFAHIFGGLILLTVAIFRSFSYKIHKKNLVLMQVTNTYWHFVGILWFILFLFIYFASQV